MSKTATYALIESQVLGSATASFTFSSIPATYTDLVLVATPLTASPANFSFQFNGDTGSNYSATGLAGNGSGTFSWRQINSTVPYLGYYSYSDTNQSNNIISIMDYSNTTTNKSFIARANNATVATEAIAGLWRNTAAINSIKVLFTGGANFNSGSIFRLYGIQAGNA